MGPTFNPKGSVRKCAFCKYWNDPTNSAIRPLPGGYWEYDSSAMHECLRKHNMKMKGVAGCTDFECKLPKI